MQRGGKRKGEARSPREGRDRKKQETNLCNMKRRTSFYFYAQKKTAFPLFQGKKKERPCAKAKGGTKVHRREKKGGKRREEKKEKGEGASTRKFPYKRGGGAQGIGKKKRGVDLEELKKKRKKGVSGGWGGGKKEKTRGGEKEPIEGKKKGGTARSLYPVGPGKGKKPKMKWLAVRGGGKDGQHAGLPKGREKKKPST